MSDGSIFDLSKFGSDTPPLKPGGSGRLLGRKAARGRDRDPASELHPGRDTEPRRGYFALKEIWSMEPGACVICGNASTPRGPIVPVLDGTEHPVCLDCLGYHAPELASILQMHDAPPDLETVRNIFDAADDARALDDYDHTPDDARYEPEPTLQEHVRNHAYQLQYLQERVSELEARVQRLLRNTYGPDLDGMPF